MVEIIPAILTENKEDYFSKIKSLEPLVEWVQVDIVDGQFAHNRTIDYSAIGFYETSLKIEAHLMVNSPETMLLDFLGIGVDRIIFPIETAKEPEKSVALVKDSGIEVGVSLNPETKIDQIEKLVDQVNTILLMSVHPGFQDQGFIPETLEKLTSLRNKYPKLTIEVDGGIDPKVAPQLVRAGADILISGSFIFEYGNIEKAVTLLREVSQLKA